MKTLFCALTAAAAFGVLFTLSPLGEAHAQGNCVTLPNNHTFTNGSSRAVMVRWSDQGLCSGGTCETNIGAGSSAAITPIDGAACWNVAWYPNNPPRPNC